MRLSILLLALAACDEAPPDDQADALAVDQAPPPVVTTVVGTCPGPVTVTLSGLTPGGGWAIAKSPNLAPGVVIPGGPCAGTPLRIGPPTTLAASGTATPAGTTSFTVVLPPAACGWYIQPLDVATCTTGMFYQF